MMDVMWITLTRNAVLLLGLFAVFEATYLIPDSKQRLRQGVSSLFIAVICFAVMSTPFVLYTGVVFDTRTIIISITSLIFGLIPSMVVMAVATIIRLSAGGAGMIAGVLTIITSGMVGLIWRRSFDPEKTKN